MLVTLVNPRHPYAPPHATEPLGQVYMPTGLYVAAARLSAAGVQVRLEDANLRLPTLEGDFLGFSLTGAPSIPAVSALSRRLSKSRDLKLAVGGQVVAALTPEQRAALFGPSSVNGNDDASLKKLMGLGQDNLPPPEAVSLIPIYEQISSPDMALYLSREFSLYLSQGCRFACTFCAAVRSARDPATQRIVRVAERYRDLLLVKGDLEYLMRRASELGISNLRIYLSNLDLFQTPPLLMRFAEQAIELQRNVPKVRLSFRGLSTVDSFLKADETHPEVLLAMGEAGLERVGFGIDGGQPQVWRAIRKAHHSTRRCIEAIRAAREKYGLTPEALMVFGHNGVDTEESMRSALELATHLIGRYSAVPRPHVAKSFVPGNDGWHDPANKAGIQELLHCPEAFQALDFTALPSRLTHPDPAFRSLTEEYFLRMCDLKESTTKYTLPLLPELPPEEKEKVRKFNEGRYDV